MEASNLRQKLVDLFRSAGQAHHQAFIETDGDDPEWPLWYANYLLDPLGKELGASFTKSELVYLLVLVSKEQALRSPGAVWAAYYADFFLQRYPQEG